MKPKKLKLQLNKETIANLHTLQSIMGGDEVVGDTTNTVTSPDTEAAYLSSIKECTGFMCCDPKETDYCVTYQNAEKTIRCDVSNVVCV
jgi:hypothetical protein